MKFASAYEPGSFEADIYAAWEAADEFLPGGEVGADALAWERPTDEAVENGERPATYSIVMPPPNANGNLHIGHGLTIAIEDSLTRYHRLRGDLTWYVPGADHAGFETWVVYEKVLEKAGKTRFEYTRDELYAQVWDFVQEQRGNMELQVRALGASCSWKDLTFTLDENVVRRVYATFEKMWKDGMIYRGEKLVNYCTKHQTAFADIEVEHKDEKGKLWDIAYRVVQKQSSDNKSAQSQRVSRGPAAASSPMLASGSLGDPQAASPLDSPLLITDLPSEIIVSTTRPETLFGDVAVAVNPEDERYKDLIGMSVELPLTDRRIPIIADEHADPEYGTGAVKITPAHDNDDFEVGERHTLPRIQVIGFDGKMLPVCGPEYEGLSTAECRKKVLKDLKEAGVLRGEREIVHSVAHCYKCGTVIEPMLKEQWFIDVKRLAKTAIEHLEAGEIKFYPESKKQVLINYLEGLKDWNISRQIPWGIPIPMFRKASGERSASSEDALLAHRTLSTARSGAPSSSHNISPEASHGSGVERSASSADALLSRRTSSTAPSAAPASSQSISAETFRGSGVERSASSTDALLAHRTSSTARSGAPVSSHLTASERSGSEEPEWIFDTRTNLTEIEIGGERYVRDEDTFDTWFSSSHWPIVCTNYEDGTPNPYYPLSVMETGADILFAWVARMIMMGLYVIGEVPFREVYLHGLVLDEHGQKMSKSKGNVINPMEMVAKYGSDAFRLGILRGRSAGMNQAFSEQAVVAGRNLCNKLWNISRFIQETVDNSASGRAATSFALTSSASGRAATSFALTSSASGRAATGPAAPSSPNLASPDGADSLGGPQGASPVAGMSESYTTLNMGEDWILREINEAKWQIESQMKNYRFSEAVETIYSLIWDKYANWFIESEKMFKNVELLRVSLEAILKLFHPFAPFVTEAIWQSLSWTSGFLISEKWPSDFVFDPISAENFERLMVIVSGVRGTLQGLSEAHKGFSREGVALLYGDDSLVDDNSLLVQSLSRVSSVISDEGQPRGLRLGLANTELYLDVAPEVVASYAKALEARILSVGRELDALNARMMNPAYVDKAPAALVKETQDAISEKEALIERLKREREAI